MDDKFVQQPRSLLDIASEKYANIYIQKLKQNQLLVDPERETVLWKDFPILQEKCADLVYKHMHQGAKELRTLIRSAILVPFSIPEKSALTELDLSGFALTENLLAKVLTAQKNTLKVIRAYDMDYTQRLDMYHVCKYLKENKVVMPAMNRLSCNQLYLLMEPKFQNHQIRSSFLTDMVFDIHNPEASTSALTSILNDNHVEDDFMPTLSESKYKRAGFFDYPPVKNVMPHLLSFMPNLKQLQIARDTTYDHFQQINDSNDFLVNLAQNATKVNVLDIHGWPTITKGTFLAFYYYRVTHLLLRDVGNIEALVSKISECQNIIYLDVSNEIKDNRPIEYAKPNTTLFNLTKSLRNLQYLDISGTNLHMTGNSNDIIPEGMLAAHNHGVESSITGLKGLTKKLKVLGLYGCENSGDLPNLPAERVFSNCNEVQLVFALEVYRSRPASLYQAMNEAYYLYRNHAVCYHALDAMKNLIRGMKNFPLDTHIVTAGTAAIFYILKKINNTTNAKKYVAKVLTDSLVRMYHDQIVVRNVALTLCQFDFSNDVIDDYANVMEYILRSMRLHNSDPFTNRVIIYLMNSMACYLSGEQRSRVGQIGAITLIMKEIIKRQETLEADRVLEACWSFLWNITDETPKNCYRFIKHSGLDLMLNVYQQFPNELEIVRNMMGLLGNISEVQAFRKLIMKHPFVSTLKHLLQTIHLNTEVSYNVAAVLANLLSDGEKIWKIRGQHLAFKEVYNLLISSVNKWDLQGSRIINYHSLRPIIRLLHCDQSYASQIWAAWALANLLTTDNEKYGNIFTSEDGVDALVRLRRKFSPAATISKLITKIEEKLKAFRADILDGYVDGYISRRRCPPDYFVPTKYEELVGDDMDEEYDLAAMFPLCGDEDEFEQLNIEPQAMSPPLDDSASDSEDEPDMD